MGAKVEVKTSFWRLAWQFGMDVTPKSSFMYSVYTIIKYFTMVHQNWKRGYAFIVSFFWVRGIYGHIRATTWIFLLALLQKYAVSSLKLNFLSIITPSRLSQLLFSIEQSSNGSFAVMSKLEKRWQLPCLAFMPFLRKYLKVLPKLLLICFQLRICFFKYFREYYRQYNLHHILHQPE